MIKSENLKEMSELEILKFIRDPNTNEYDYNVASEYIIKKYEPMIHKHWWILQKQMNNTPLINSLKEDYYDEAYNALFNAILKINFDKVKPNFKLMQMANWYITNARNSIIKRIDKVEKKNRQLTIVNIDFDEEDLTIDSSVDKAYNEYHSHEIDPYTILTDNEGELNCKSSIERCMSNWTDKEKKIFEYLEMGKNKTEIATLCGINNSRISPIIKKMKNDLKKELSYNSLNYNYN